MMMQPSSERSSLLLTQRRRQPNSSSTTLATALRFVSVSRARLARGDAYALGNALFLAGSAAYCTLDLLPPVGTYLDDALLVGLAALFVADAALYLRTWGGALVGRGPCLGRSVCCGGYDASGGGGRCGGCCIAPHFSRVHNGEELVLEGGATLGAGSGAGAGGDKKLAEEREDGAEEGPSHLDLAAEWVNISASSLYLVATVIGLQTPSTDVAIPQLALIYALQGLSSVLFFADAILYAASWHAGLPSNDESGSSGGDSGGSGGPSGDVKSGLAFGGGRLLALFRSPHALAHVLNVLPAFAYAVCGLASLVLFALETAAGRGTDRFEDNRNVRGRLIAGAEPPEIEIACIAADFAYLTCSLCTVAAWWTEVEAEEREAELASGMAAVSSSSSL